MGLGRFHDPAASLVHASGFGPLANIQPGRWPVINLGLPVRNQLQLLRSLELIYGVIALAVISGIWLAAPWIAANWLRCLKRLPISTVSLAISFMGLVLASRMAEQVYRGSIQGLQRQVWLSGAQSVLATMRWGGAVIVLAWMEASIEAFFLWQGFVSVLSVTILAHIKTYGYLPPTGRNARFDFVAISRISRFAGGMALTTFLALLLTQIDKLALSNLVSLEEFGHYTLAASVASALALLVTPISTAVYPRLTELVTRTEHETLVTTYHRASQWLAAAVVPAGLAIAAFAEPLLLAWTGNAAISQNTAPILALLALGTMLNGMMYLPHMLQLAHGWTGFINGVNMVAVLFIVPAVLWSVPRFGATGAAWAWLVLNVGYVFISMHFMHRLLLPGERSRWYRDSVLWPLYFTVVAPR